MNDIARYKTLQNKLDEATEKTLLLQETADRRLMLIERLTARLEVSEGVLQQLLQAAADEMGMTPEEYLNHDWTSGEEGAT